MTDIYLDLHNCQVCRDFWDGDVENAEFEQLAAITQHVAVAHPHNTEIPVSIKNGRTVRNIRREDVPAPHLPVYAPGANARALHAACAAPPSPACPLTRFTVYWCNGPMGVHIDGSSGLWNGERLQPVEVVPATQYDALLKAAKEAHEKWCDGLECPLCERGVPR